MTHWLRLMLNGMCRPKPAHASERSPPEAAGELPGEDGLPAIAWQDPAVRCIARRAPDAQARRQLLLVARRRHGSAGQVAVPVLQRRDGPGNHCVLRRQRRPADGAGELTRTMMSTSGTGPAAAPQGDLRLLETDVARRLLFINHPRPGGLHRHGRHPAGRCDVVRAQAARSASAWPPEGPLTKEEADAGRDL